MLTLYPNYLKNTSADYFWPIATPSWNFLWYKTWKLCPLKERTVTFCITAWLYHCCQRFTLLLLQHWYPTIYLSSCSVNAFYFLNKSISALCTPSSTATSLCKRFPSAVVLMANSLCRRVGQPPDTGYWYLKKIRIKIMRGNMVNIVHVSILMAFIIVISHSFI